MLVLLVTTEYNYLSFIMKHLAWLLGHMMPYATKLFLIGMLFLFFKLIDAFLIKRLLMSVYKNLHKENDYKRISKLVTFAWWVLFIFAAVSLIFGNVLGLLASFGLIGFGITFALQKPILNFVGWVTIILKHVYSEGDRIKVGEIRGDVKEIQVMNTVLDGLLERSDRSSGKIVTFPNELVLTSEVQNYTKNYNYLVEEISITITYESDYHKARKLLREIIIDLTRKNKSHYKRNLNVQRKKVNAFISGLLTKYEGIDSKEADEEAKKLQIEREQIDLELQKFDEEFKPRIRIDLLDSAIQLIAQFFTPYDKISKNKTEIFLAFLDAVKQEKNIEIAYPHLQIVRKGKT
jgi:small-conductance mechanosensitive channel